MISILVFLFSFILGSIVFFSPPNKSVSCLCTCVCMCVCVISKRLLREYFVRCSHGTTATDARTATAAASGILPVIGTQTNRLDQRPVLQHVQVRVQREVHCYQQVACDVKRRELIRIRSGEPGQQYRHLRNTTTTSR